MSDFTHVHAAAGDAADCPECLRAQLAKANAIIAAYKKEFDAGVLAMPALMDKMEALETLLREVVSFHAPPWDCLSIWQKKALARFPHLKEP